MGLEYKLSLSAGSFRRNIDATIQCHGYGGGMQAGCGHGRGTCLGTGKGGNGKAGNGKRETRKAQRAIGKRGKAALWAVQRCHLQANCRLINKLRGIQGGRPGCQRGVAGNKLSSQWQGFVISFWKML